ncbi:hypothetical protein BpHYR1_025709 [Brachionus plicatilis]|uniref:Uncharacterized protein n=1 Tax=Brachionus plicatilis TaxID=10195 RepID=A0A3M7RF70_BRAPC|nr:hypothetical protein BpHYR1_025709 [Brachionus plicatilis]
MPMNNSVKIGNLCVHSPNCSETFNFYFMKLKSKLICSAHLYPQSYVSQSNGLRSQIIALEHLSRVWMRLTCANYCLDSIDQANMALDSFMACYHPVQALQIHWQKKNQQSAHSLSEYLTTC